jgi:hypothetical protein
VWVVLKQVPDCRWLLDREDCPWSPAMRLFRQKECDDWVEVIDRAAQALRTLRTNRAGLATASSASLGAGRPAFYGDALNVAMYQIFPNESRTPAPRS